MKPSDIAALTWISDPQLSPDGRHVAYVVNGIDRAKNKYRSQIWVTGTDGTIARRPLTSSKRKDRKPRWSPDGRRLAFTSSRKKGKQRKTRSTLRVLPLDIDGETITLAHSDEDFDELTWSPDGSRLAFSMRTRGDHYDHDRTSRRPARKIDHLFFTLNGEGFIIDRPRHVYAIAADGSGEPVDLTPGGFECSSPAWFPDGGRLTVAANRFRTDFALDIGVVDAATGADPTLRLLTDGTGSYMLPTVTSDGSSVIVTGFDDPTVDPQHSHLGVLDANADPSGTPKWITKTVDRSWFSFHAEQPPTWTPAGELVAAVEDRGNTHLWRVPLDGSDPERIVGGEVGVTGWSSGAIDGRPAIAYTSPTTTSPDELFLWVDGKSRQLTTVTQAFTATTRPQPAEHFLATSGDVEVDAWIYRPHDFDPAQKYPTLLNIHGGPFTQYGPFFFDEFQMQAAAGYVVVYSNPRGGSGREETWGQAILGPKHQVPGSGWGGVDYDDCMAVVDSAIKQFDFIDTDRLGVLGGSYGGYMASWIVTHTDRFAAACSERAVNNLLALESNSDYAGAFGTQIGPRFVDDPDEYMRMSPITYVKDLNTPLMILHAEDDLRCPQDQATQLFTACQLLDKPDVDFWLFPGENHELSRNGSPAHRKQRAEIILDFFDHHLRGRSGGGQGRQIPEQVVEQ